MSYFLVLTPVSELKQDDWVCDEHGGRRITSIRRENTGAYIEFSEGPANWFHNSELFPTERLS